MATPVCLLSHSSDPLVHSILLWAFQAPYVQELDSVAHTPALS